MIYYALTSDGLLTSLGDCGDFIVAEEIAEDCDLDVVWIINQEDVKQWSSVLVEVSHD